MGPLELNLAGTAYRLDFGGFHRPLGVSVGTLTITLPPWTYRRHMDTLRLCTAPSPSGLRLDSRILCDAVLNGLVADDESRRLIAPIALWWAAGGDAPLAQPPAEGEWLELGSYDNPARVRLRPWTEHQRLAALDAALSDELDDETLFDPVRYLERMVEATVATLDAPGGIDDLDARATALLLHATVALNVLDEEADRLLQGGEAARQCAARTLRLCQALGWTPAKVWATPAAEVDRLLRMLDLLQPARTPQRRSLADHPDATVIRIEDDGTDNTDQPERMSR
ncbi:hypothetical protein [Zoogloea sp.]|uniref:hypothetical protein n=1 Tax=Zoogloea sp. TaxID=49181 RepID=UPI0035AE003B